MRQRLSGRTVRGGRSGAPRRQRRGRTVTVCGSGNCVTVKLIDWCACGSGRVIDLYSDAFSRLAPTSAGTVSVRVSW